MVIPVEVSGVLPSDNVVNRGLALYQGVRVMTYQLQGSPYVWVDAEDCVKLLNETFGYAAMICEDCVEVYYCNNDVDGSQTVELLLTPVKIQMGDEMLALYPVQNV